MGRTSLSEHLSAELRQCGTALFDGRVSRVAHRRRLLDLVARRFPCEECSLWREHPAQTARMQCIALRGTDMRAAPATPAWSARQSFWSSLTIGTVTCHGPGETGLSVPDGLQLLLAPFTLNGRIWGTLAVLQQHNVSWTPTEAAALMRLASAISLQVTQRDQLDDQAGCRADCHARLHADAACDFTDCPVNGPRKT